MRARPLQWLTVVALCTLACDSTNSSPTDPGGDPLAVLEGEVGHEGIDFRAVDVGAGDTVRIRLEDLEFIAGEPPEFDPLLGVGIGFLNAAGDACARTSFRFLLVGQDWLLHLSGARYCVDMFDPGIIPEEGRVAYRVALYDALD